MNLLPDDQLFTPFLKESESMLWRGQPKKGIQLRDADMILIPMSIILIGFALILNYILWLYSASFLLHLFGALLAAGGIYLGVIRFFVDASKRARTFYGISDKRVIVLTRNRKPAIKTLPLKNIDRMDITLEKDGSGFIIFGNTNPLYPWLLGGFYFTGESVPGLELLPDVRMVYDLLNKQIRIPVSPLLTTAISQSAKDELN